MLNTQNVGYGYGYVVSEDLPKYIRGRLFTLIEALGLKETQEKSLKDLVDNEIWSQFGQSWRSQWITANLHTAVRNVIDEIKKEESGKGMGSDNTLPAGHTNNYKFKITYEAE